MKKQRELPVEYIMENTKFDDNGDLIWSTKRKGRAQFSRVGCITRNGKGIPTAKASMLGQAFILSRICWCRHHGRAIPDGMIIDHIDGNPLNNKVENLQLKTFTGNNKNKKMQKNNSTGITGVRACGKMWIAYIGKKLIYKGRDFFEAACARKSAEAADPEITSRHGI